MAEKKKKKQRNRFLDYLVYLALRAVASIMQCFPIEWNLQTARLIGDVLYFTSKKHRARIRHNLGFSFPGLSEAEYRRLGRKSMQALPMLGVDFICTPRLMHLYTLGKHVRFHNYAQTVDMLIRQKGLITVTGHYGNWEVVGYAMGVLGFSTLYVARSLDNKYVSDWVMAERERMGHRLIDKRGATTEVTEALGAGKIVGFIADQNAGSKGMFVDFFGRKASTYKSIGLLAMQYEVPVLIGYARRLEDRFLFELGVQDVIMPDDWKDQPDPLRYITERYTKAIEGFVRRDPWQYLWVHRRWKTRPKGETAEKYD